MANPPPPPPPPTPLARYVSRNGLTIRGQRACTLNFKKQHSEENLINRLFSYHCLCHLVPCISMKLSTFVQWSFVVIENKSARICFNIFEDSVIQNFKIEKQETVALFPCRGRKNLRIYCWYSFSDLKHDPKRFIVFFH